jgi:colanic acid/amylovoran biosynthesis protein
VKKKGIFKVCLLGGSFETGNMGVSALTASLVDIIMKVRPESEITLIISHDRECERSLSVRGAIVRVRSLPYRMSPLSKPGYNALLVSLLSLLARLPFLRKWAVAMGPLLRLIDEADFVGDIHGGDSFSDIYQYFRFWRSCMPLLWVLRLGKPLHMLPQTYGPFSTRRGGRLAEKILRRAASIAARDEESRVLAASYSGKEDIRVIPDVAFCLEAEETAAGMEEIRPLSSRPLLGINVSGLMYNGGYTRDNMFALKMDYPAFSKALLERILADTGYDVVLVPHTGSSPTWSVENDRFASEEVLAALPERLRSRALVVKGRYDQGEVKSIIGRCSVFIGARMHSCIAALSQGIPTVGVAYSKKFSGVFGVVGVPEWVLPARELGTEEAVVYAMGLVKKADSLRSRLAIRIPELQRKSIEYFGSLL